ncbi:unnamed protein product, partial [Pocillopora meandrina]
ILNKITWLCDSEIHAGQILLKQKFPLVDGLRDPVIVGALVTPAISEFVQIINTGSHWVCLSTIATMQKQTNSNDCGLFALAFATDLCHGLDP